MPLYDYSCEKCGIEFERVLKISDCDSRQQCPYCGSNAMKIIVNGSGGIWRRSDDCPWIRDTVANILHDSPDDPRPNPNMRTADDLRNYLRTHPNIRPREDHPLYPSSYGDCFESKTDPKFLREQRSRKAHELIRKKRSINITG